MIQDTSRITYDELRKSGKLSNLQAKVYEYILETKGATILEIATHIRKWPGTVSGRIAELREKGLIKQGLKRHCKIDQRLAINWLPNDNQDKQMEFL